MKNVIFDLDGTLLNTLTDLTNSTNYALNECNFPTHTIEEVRNMVGNGVEMLIRRAIPQTVSEQDFEKCFSKFKEHYIIHCEDNTTPYSGIIDLLKEIHKQHSSISVASNKLQPAVQKLCDEYFSPYVKYALGDCPELQRKPKPDMILKAMELMSSNKDNTIYVGDSEVDIATAKAAGIHCVSVLWGFRDKDFLIKNGATSFITKPIELLNFL